MRRKFVSAVLTTLILGTMGSLTLEAGTGQDAAMATQKVGPSASGMPAGSADKLSYTGSFAYSYPIEIPPGVAGVQPHLSLDYNSSAGNGWAGVGWQLSLGAIQRSTKNGVPTYTDADIFTIDTGEGAAELVPSDAGSINFRRKIEGSFDRIVREGAGWCVYGRDGSRSYYGVSPAGRSGPDAGRTFLWALEKVVDRNENFFTISYVTDGGALYPDVILYTGHPASGLLHRKVKFTTQVRPDPWCSYRAGFRLDNSLRLTTIETFVNTTGAAAGPWLAVRRYTLGYASRNFGTRSELSTIQVTGVDGQNLVTLPFHRFNYLDNLTAGQFWNGASPGYALPERITYGQRDNGLRFADLDGDARPDLVRRYSVNGNTTIQTWRNIGGAFQPDSRWQLPAPVTVEGNGSWYDGGVRLVDLNGDGLADAIQSTWNHGSNVREAWINDGQAFVQNTAWKVPDSFWFSIVDSFNGGEWFRDNGIVLLDVNGDGRPDLVQSLYVDSPANSGTRTRRVRLNTGTGWASQDSPEWALPVDLTLISNDGRSSVPNGVEFVDLNGDGLVDIVQKIRETVTGSVASNVWLNTGAGWAYQPTAWSLPDFLMYRTATVPFDNGIRFADINGDGLPDIVQSVRTTWPIAGTFKRAFLNTGSGWTAAVTCDVPQLFSDIDPAHMASTNQGVALVDLNGDGSVDVVRSWAAPGVADIRSSSLGILNPEVIAQVTSPAGGTLQTIYTAASLEGTHRIPFPVTYLKILTTGDGRGGSSQEVYSYAGGLFDPVEREFLGFSRVDTLDAVGSKTTTFFHQVTSDAGGRMAGNPLKGRPYREEHGNLVQTFSRTEIEWEAPLIGAARFARIKSRTETLLDGAAPASTRVQYAYDDGAQLRAGNITQIFKEGDPTLSGDDETQEFEYAAPSAGYLASFPKRRRLIGPAGQVVADTQFLYDGLPYGSVAKGNVTAVRRWLDKPVPARWIETGETFDPRGNVLEQVDARGNRTITQYDPFGFPASIRDRAGHTTSLTFTPRTGSLASSTDPNGQTSSFVYDPLGRIIKEISPLDSASSPTVAYNYHDELVGSPGAQNFETQYRERSATPNVLWSRSYFDGLGRTWRTEREHIGDSVIADVQFDVRGLPSATSVPRLKSAAVGPLWIRTEFDPLGRPTSVTQPDGTAVTTSYAGRLTRVRTAKGATFSVETDAYGRIVSRTESGVGLPTAYLYDAADNLTSMVNSRAQISSFSYDSLGRKVSTNDPNAGAWVYAYDDNGNVTSQTDPRGVRLSFTYDAMDRLIRRTLAADPSSSTGKAVGAVLASYSYDETAGRPFSTGRLTSVADPSGTLAFYHDPIGRVTKAIRTVDGVSYEIQNAFDSLSRLTSVRYPSDDVVSYSYNDAGVVDSITDAAGTVLMKFMNHDALRRPTLTDFGGGKIRASQTYDPVKGILSRARIESFSGGTGTTIRDVAYEYDSNRNLIRTADNLFSSRSQTFNHDALNRLIYASGDYGAEIYAYDDVGNLLSKAGKTYAYGDPNHPAAVTAVSLPARRPASDSSTLIAWGLEPSESIYGASLSTGMSFVPGVYNGAVSFDGTSGVLAFPESGGISSPTFTMMIWVKPASFPASGYATLMAKCGDVPLKLGTDGWRLVLNPSGQPIVEMARGTTRFSYWCPSSIALNQWSFLVVSYDGAKMRFFINGMKIGERVFSGSAAPNAVPVTIGASLDAGGLPAKGTFFKGTLDEPRLHNRNWDAEEIAQAALDFNAGTTYAYDAAGNCVSRVINGQRWTYRYDADERLWQVLAGTVPVATFTYDAFGGRVKKATPAGTTLYIDHHFEIRPNGSRIAHVQVSDDSACDIVRSGPSVGAYYLLGDHLGSVSLVTTSTGAVAQESRYRPFGERYFSSGSSSNLRWYTGQEEDAETGLDYYGARYYDPALGRFISPDSVVPSALDPQSLNRYAYARNNPVVFNDPSGHSWLSRGWDKLVDQIVQNPPRPDSRFTRSDAEPPRPGDSGDSGLPGGGSGFVSAQRDLAAIMNIQFTSGLLSLRADALSFVVEDGLTDSLVGSGDGRKLISALMGSSESEDARRFEAGLGLVSGYLYWKIAGYRANGAAGIGYREKDALDAGVEGANNVGFAHRGSPTKFWDEGNSASKVLNGVFAVNAAAGVHDRFQVELERGFGRLGRDWGNIPGMLVAGAISVPALFLDPRRLYYGEFNRLSEGLDR